MRDVIDIIDVIDDIDVIDVIDIYTKCLCFLFLLKKEP